MKRKLIIVGLIATLVLYLLSMSAAVPNDIGIQNGSLAPLPESPNAVSTQAADPQRTMPALALEESSADAIKRIAEIVKEMPRTHIVTQSDNYLHAQSTSLIFRFVDDVEFLVSTDEGVIHFRSASRVGHSDMGANRKRMAAITHAWNSK